MQFYNAKIYIIFCNRETSLFFLFLQQKFNNEFFRIGIVSCEEACRAAGIQPFR